MFAEKLMVVLRDGRKIMGVLRSWDQYGTEAGGLPISLQQKIY
jgi:hypothetical protein